MTQMDGLTGVAQTVLRPDDLKYPVILIWQDG